MQLLVDLPQELLPFQTYPLDHLVYLLMNPFPGIVAHLLHALHSVMDGAERLLTVSPPLRQFLAHLPQLFLPVINLHTDVAVELGVFIVQQGTGAAQRLLAPPTIDAINTNAI